MVGLFASSLIVSATLLFAVQPMLGKMVLPLLGGSPAVWNTCLVFFQATLLAGYAYAHLVARRLGSGTQVAVHALVLLLALASLPFAIGTDWQPPTSGGQVVWLIGLLTVTVGLPFLAVSATAPLLQRWFADTGHCRAHDPYFLYSSSNVGSVAGLLLYPLAIEPSFSLASQASLWAVGFGLLAALTLACAAAMWRSRKRRVADPPERAPKEPGAASPQAPTGRDRAWWFVLAMVPASLLYGTTTYIATDVASFPLLWVIPLTIYLGTFINAFARRPLISARLASALLPVAVLAVLPSLSLDLGSRPSLMVGHLCVLGLAGLVAHGRLASARPATAHLTEFYLWVSAGGVAGGVLNALIAPVLLTQPLEYPAMLVAACFLRVDFRRGDLWGTARPGPASASRRSLVTDLLLPMSPGASMALVPLFLDMERVPDTVMAGIVAIPVVLCVLFAVRAVRFGLAVASLTLAGMLLQTHGNLLYAERSFFGVVRVVEDREQDRLLLLHGTTLHGEQWRDPARRTELSGYYHPGSPVAQVFRTPVAAAPDARVGVLGLGTGATACLGTAGQHWTFFEIDPAIERVARRSGLFSYLTECPPSVRVIIGDGRQLLEREPNRQYDVLLLDAFTSDAIPVHLLTREAIEMYRRKLAPGGLLVFHVSNRFLDLAPVLAAAARSLGLSMVTGEYEPVGESTTRIGSVFCVLAESPDALNALIGGTGWTVGAPRPAASSVWTDDFSPVLTAFRWRRR